MKTIHVQLNRLRKPKTRLSREQLTSWLPENRKPKDAQMYFFSTEDS